MGAWSLSPPPNVPGNTADSGPRCIGNERAALMHCMCVCVSVTDVLVPLVTAQNRFLAQLRSATIWKAALEQH